MNKCIIFWQAIQTSYIYIYELHALFIGVKCGSRIFKWSLSEVCHGRNWAMGHTGYVTTTSKTGASWTPRRRTSWCGMLCQLSLTCLILHSRKCPDHPLKWDHHFHHRNADVYPLQVLKWFSKVLIELKVQFPCFYPTTVHFMYILHEISY